MGRHIAQNLFGDAKDLSNGPTSPSSRGILPDEEDPEADTGVRRVDLESVIEALARARFA